MKGQDKSRSVESEAAELFPELFGSGFFDASASVSNIAVSEQAESQALKKYGSEFDIHALMDQAVDPLTGTLRDLKIDDRDMPLAKNFFDFTTNFCQANPPWARQMLVWINLFGEYCPHCLKDKDRLDPLSVEVDFDSREISEYIPLLEYGKCPKCGGRKHEFVLNKEMNLYQELVLVWGQRGGKSTTGASGSAYQHHRFLKLPKLSSLDPQNILPFTQLTGTFVSLTFSKAFALLWTPFKSLVELTPWFTEYNGMLDHYGNKYGAEMYRVRDEFMVYHHKNIRFYPSHPAANILRGDTRIHAAIDELGLFPMPRDKASDDADETSERANAKEAINSLETSLANINKTLRRLLFKGFDHMPSTLLLGLSSPKHQKDMVMRRLRFTKTEIGSKIALGSQLATWEINPGLPRDDPYIISKFEADPIAAMRDLGAQPPSTSANFVPRTHFTKEHYPFVGSKNQIKYEYEYGGPDNTEVWAVLKNASPGKVKYPTVLAMDAGLNNNSFSIVAVGADPDNEFKLTVPAILEVIPRGTTINFNRMYKNVLLPFSAAMNCQAWIADRWNSLDILSRAKDEIKGLQTFQRSLRLVDFDNFLQVMWNSNLVLPLLDKELATEVKDLEFDDYRPVFYERGPVQHLLHQFITVQSGPGGGCPEKAIGLTDDNFRALVLGVYALTNKQISTVIKNRDVSYQDVEGGDGGGLAIFGGRSGMTHIFPGITGFRR